MRTQRLVMRVTTKLLIITSFLAWCMMEEEDKMKGFLLYEDQREVICSSTKTCWNSLTLKKKMNEKEISMKDFTFCFRFNLLSYRKKGKPHTIFRTKTDKYSSSDWTTGFHYELNPVDGPGNGVVTIQTFNERLEYVIASNGVYTIWPIYNTEVNANQWNSFCLGSDLQRRNIFLARNGHTIHNFSQPQLWADLNMGLDTSALEPFQVWLIDHQTRRLFSIFF